MRPLRLEMAGFGPFREPTEVDFTDVDLLALVGPTGSGKSTIIDAITFALYGSVARYDDNKLVAPVVNQMSNEARVLLDFESDGVVLTAVRVVRRTKGGRATTKEARLEREGETIAGSVGELDEAIGRLVGLTFDQFTKTVVLPQGRFARFLHDKPADRQELLRQLLDLGVYKRMGSAARDRASTERIRADTLASQLDDADAVTEERVAELRAVSVTLTDAQVSVQALLTEQRVLEEQLESATAERNRIDSEHTLLQSVETPAEVAALGKKLVAAEAAAADAAKVMADAQALVAKARFDVEAGPDRALTERLLAGYDSKDDLDAKLATATALTKAATKDLAAATKRAEKIRASIAKLELAVDEARSASESAAAAAADGPQIDVIDLQSEFHKRLAELEKETAAATKADTAAARVAEQAEGQAASARRSADEAAEAVADLRVAAGATALMATLVVGEPCPVCRQAVAAIPDHDHDAALAEATALQEKAGKTLADAMSELDGARAEAANAAGALAALVKERTSLATRLESVPSASELAKQRKLADRLVADRAKAGAALVKAEGRLVEVCEGSNAVEALEAEEEARGQLDEVERSGAEAATRVETIAAQLAGAPPRKKLAADLATIERFANAFTVASDNEGNAASRAARADEHLDGLRASEVDARVIYGTTRDGLAALGPPPPENASLHDDWKVFSAWAKAQAKRLAKDLRAAKTAADKASEVCAWGSRKISALCDAHLDGAAPTDPAAQLAARAAQAHAAVEAAERSLAHEASLRSEIADLAESADVASALGRLLQVDGFERWLLEEVVADLVDRATERLLELSGGQYSLEAEGANFLVRDHRNAGELRDAKTLSGGETFLASLALALALADNIADLGSEQSPRLEAIFLDEGFGTLDPDTLDVVAVAIEELGATGRMVGIVTHIRELAERMPVRFEITKGPTTSTIARIEI